MKANDYGYKAAKNSIITLQILGKTNESRADIFDSNFAKFRCSKALVVDIEDFWTKEKTNIDKSIYRESFIYEVGKEVVPDIYNEDLNIVCAPGIHYFKTKEAAEAYFLENSIRKQDGLQHLFHDNGRVKNEVTYQNGLIEGLYREWYENGSLKEECKFIAGSIEGIYKDWHENGQLSMLSTYKNNRRDSYKKWDQNGVLTKTISYVDGFDPIF